MKSVGSKLGWCVHLDRTMIHTRSCYWSEDEAATWTAALSIEIQFFTGRLSWIMHLTLNVPNFIQALNPRTVGMHAERTVGITSQVLFAMIHTYRRSLRRVLLPVRCHLLLRHSHPECTCAPRYRRRHLFRSNPRAPPPPPPCRLASPCRRLGFNPTLNFNRAKSNGQNNLNPVNT